MAQTDVRIVNIKCKLDHPRSIDVDATPVGNGNTVGHDDAPIELLDQIMAKISAAFHNNAAEKISVNVNGDEIILDSTKNGASGAQTITPGKTIPATSIGRKSRTKRRSG